MHKKHISNVDSNTEVSSSDSMFGGKFILGSFNGFPTGITATTSDIVDIFLHHQHQMVYSILWDILKKYCYLGHKLRRKHISQWTSDDFLLFSKLINNSSVSFSQSYKIGVYQHTHFAENHLYWIDKEILNYFRHLGFDVSIDMSKPLSAGVTTPIYIKISSK